MIDSSLLPIAIITSFVGVPDDNNGSPINFLDNDILNNLLPEYVAKMRRKVWWENLFNNTVRCIKGNYDDDYRYILDNKFTVKKSDKLRKLFAFGGVLSQCEGYLETLFKKEYNMNPESRDFIPKIDKDFIPFYNLFMKLSGMFDTSMLSDYRMNNKYSYITKYYKYLQNSDDPYIKEIKKNNNLRHAFKYHAFFNMKTNYNKLYMIKQLFDIDIDERDFKENREFIKEKCEDIKLIKKSVVPYTKKLTDKDKEIMVEALENYYYVIASTKSLDPWHLYYYDLDEAMENIKINIEIIKSM